MNKHLRRYLIFEIVGSIVCAIVRARPDPAELEHAREMLRRTRERRIAEGLPPDPTFWERNEDWLLAAFVITACVTVWGGLYGIVRH
jgi:hypothetical protein